MKVIVKAVQHYESKMTPDELQEHLKMRSRGASKTKNKKGLHPRQHKHKKLIY
jgi:hypothetical protein